MTDAPERIFLQDAEDAARRACEIDYCDRDGWERGHDSSFRIVIVAPDGTETRWVDRDQSDDEFVELIAACKRGEVQYLLAHTANLGHGIDGLQDGFARMIWFQMSWSSEQYEQMLRRIARPGQTKPVFMHHILADHWLERRRLARVQDKITEQNDFINSLRTL